jgi:hypothetical protein
MKRLGICEYSTTILFSSPMREMTDPSRARIVVTVGGRHSRSASTLGSLAPRVSPNPAPNARDTTSRTGTTTRARRLRGRGDVMAPF